MAYCSGDDWYETHRNFKGGRPKILSDIEAKLKRKESVTKYKSTNREAIQQKSRQYHLDRLERLAGRMRPEKCECCGGPPNSRRSKKLEYDRNHTTGEFRGWLCRNCNSALGMVRDDIERLKHLINYLQKENQ